MEAIIAMAIREKKSISFEYRKQGHKMGLRTGNPHVLFRSSTGKILLDIFRTSGVSTKDPIPGWRQYEIRYMKNIVLHDDLPQFTIAPGYNPNGVKYKHKFEYVK